MSKVRSKCMVVHRSISSLLLCNVERHSAKEWDPWSASAEIYWVVSGQGFTIWCRCTLIFRGLFVRKGFDLCFHVFTISRWLNVLMKYMDLTSFFIKWFALKYSCNNWQKQRELEICVIIGQVANISVSQQNYINCGSVLLCSRFLFHCGTDVDTMVIYSRKSQTNHCSFKCTVCIAPDPQKAFSTSTDWKGKMLESTLIQLPISHCW